MVRVSRTLNTGTPGGSPAAGVGQVVLPATPGGSPAAREWQANVPLARNNDLPYGFFGARRFMRTESQPPRNFT